MFPPEKPKNRRFNPYELEDEICTARHWKRPVKAYVHDIPFYPGLPLTPLVNFDLKYKQ